MKKAIIISIAIISIGVTVVFADDILTAAGIRYKGTRTVEDSLNELYIKVNTKDTNSHICKFIDGTYGSFGNVGSKYECEVGHNIKYNFYLLAKNNNSVKLIMDRNINSGTVTWNNAMKYFRVGEGLSIKNAWTNIIDIDLPEAQEIADAINYDVIVTDNYIDSRYSISSDYAWLINYTNNCTSFGCTEGNDATTPGYWTRDLFFDKEWAYDVINGNFYNTNVGNTSGLGVRPVITVLTTNLYSE